MGSAVADTNRLIAFASAFCVSRRLTYVAQTCPEISPNYRNSPTLTLPKDSGNVKRS